MIPRNTVAKPIIPARIQWEPKILPSMHHNSNGECEGNQKATEYPWTSIPENTGNQEASDNECGGYERPESDDSGKNIQ